MQKKKSFLNVSKENSLDDVKNKLSTPIFIF